jgi:serine/threonine-protein kinase RsbW
MKPTPWQPSENSNLAPNGSAGQSPATDAGNATGVVGDNGVSRKEFANGESLVWRAEHEIASDPAAGQKVLEELLAKLEAHRWHDRDIFGVHLALEEAIVNAILHGNHSDANKRVHVICVLSEDRLRVEITDEGNGFDPNALPDPTCDECIDASGGRGVMLMRSFMSRVEYNERGNAVVMEKVRCRPCESEG